jgi:GH24 family phage-related lysozyme (muramidase)
MRTTERTVFAYYNDMGKDKGHCTWGPGILAHRGVCTQEELARPVSAAQVNAEFDRRVSEAEATVHRNIHVALTQAQFDALVSFTYNAGPDGSGQTFALINKNERRRREYAEVHQGPSKNADWDQEGRCTRPHHA